MSKTIHYSDGERTVIFNADKPEQVDVNGFLISGGNVTHHLFTIGSQTPEEYLRECKEETPEYKEFDASFGFEVKGFGQVVAVPANPVDIRPVPLEEIILDRPGDYHPDVIRQAKIYFRALRKGARDEDIKQFRPDIGPGGEGGKGAV